MKSLSDLEVLGKKVFVRVDLDVPIDTLNAQRLTTNAESDEAEAATRLTNLAPTVEWLIEHGAKQVFVAGHIDRPSQFTVHSSQFTEEDKDKPIFYDPKLSTRQLEKPLEMILGRSVTYKGDLDTGDGTLASMAQLILFENLRFWPQEEANDLEFAKQLANLADIYVNEAFGNCHRAHASMVALPSLLSHVEDPEGFHPRRAAGLHLETEVNQLTELIKNPKRPFVAIVGGEKIETKVPVIANLAKVADFVLVGGEIAKQLTVNSSQLTDNSKVIAASLTPNGKDISRGSISKFREIISKAKTIVWNGPMGVFEEGFKRGSAAVAEAILASGAYSVVGGGETTQFLSTIGLLGRFSFVSSGGGAMLAFLAGRELPGIVALE